MHGPHARSSRRLAHPAHAGSLAGARWLTRPAHAGSLTFAELMDVLSTTYAVDGSVAGDEVRTALDALVDAGALCRL